MDLTDNVVNELLDRAVAEKGADYVYHGTDKGSCFYFESDKTPGCIVGHIMNYVGITADSVAASEEAGKHIEFVNAADALERLDVNISPRSKSVLCFVQESQDAGIPWGEAVNSAREVFKDFA